MLSYGKSMERLTIGMQVNAIDDERIGILQAVRSCCLKVADRAGGYACLTPDAVFNISFARVTLICAPAQIGRYACKIHPAVTAAGQPAETFLG